MQYDRLSGRQLHFLLRLWCDLCFAACPPVWSEFINQNSINGVEQSGYRTPALCQDYCYALATCVAVDFNFIESSCWVHTNIADLDPVNTYEQLRTNQYRIDRTSCATTTTVARTSLLTFVLN